MEIENIPHPYADLLGMEVSEYAEGKSICAIPYDVKLNNSNHVIHGGAIYSLADTGMGAALYCMLPENESCATIEIKVTYLNPAGPYDLVCHSRVLKKGKRVAMLESEVFSDELLVAKASASFALFSTSK